MFTHIRIIPPFVRIVAPRLLHFNILVRNPPSISLSVCPNVTFLKPKSISLRMLFLWIQRNSFSESVVERGRRFCFRERPYIIPGEAPSRRVRTKKNDAPTAFRNPPGAPNSPSPVQAREPIPPFLFW